MITCDASRQLVPTEGLSHVVTPSGRAAVSGSFRATFWWASASRSPRSRTSSRARTTTIGVASIAAGTDDLLAALPCWAFLRLLSAGTEASLESPFIGSSSEELAEPLSAATLDDLQWYFEQLRTPATPRTRRDDERFRDCQVQLLIRAAVSTAPQAPAAYGDAAFDIASSPAIAEHLAKYTGQVHCLLLPVSYRHVGPIVSTPAMAGDRDRAGRAGQQRRRRGE